MKHLEWIALVGIASGCSLAPANTCRGVAEGPTPTVEQVCEHLGALGCLVGPLPSDIDAAALMSVPVDAGPPESSSDVHARECRAGHQSWSITIVPEHFDALVRCYVVASNCAEVEACNRGCATDLADAAVVAPVDAAPVDGGDGS